MRYEIKLPPRMQLLQSVFGCVINAMLAVAVYNFKRGMSVLLRLIQKLIQLGRNIKFDWKIKSYQSNFMCGRLNKK